jgi:hypothetical protein
MSLVDIHNRAQERSAEGKAEQAPNGALAQVAGIAFDILTANTLGVHEQMVKENNASHAGHVNGREQRK